MCIALERPLFPVAVAHAHHCPVTKTRAWREMNAPRPPPFFYFLALWSPLCVWRSLHDTITIGVTSSLLRRLFMCPVKLCAFFSLTSMPTRTQRSPSVRPALHHTYTLEERKRRDETRRAACGECQGREGAFNRMTDAHAKGGKRERETWGRREGNTFTLERRTTKQTNKKDKTKTYRRRAQDSR